jgi:hypothetical protein
MTLPWADAPKRPARAQLPSLTWRWDAPVTALAFSRRSGYLAAASGDGIVRIASPKEVLQKARVNGRGMMRIGERCCAIGWGNEAADIGNSGV